jgi:hypothetical protein
MLIGKCKSRPPVNVRYGERAENWQKRQFPMLLRGRKGLAQTKALYASDRFVL